MPGAGSPPPTAPAAPSGDHRHPGLTGLCDLLHDVILGRAARELLDAPAGLPAHGLLWTAPTWTWVHARIDVGRKDRGRDGEKLLLPGRLVWSTGPLHLHAGGATATASWRCSSLGHDAHGSTALSAAEPAETDPHARPTPGGSAPPTHVHLPVRSRRQLAADLADLAARGDAAYWQVLAFLEPHVRAALRRAHANVSYELARIPGQPLPLLDDTKLDSLADAMLLGEGTHPGKAAQLVTRCLRPETFTRVEPLRYIREALRVDANSAVRKALGDPHIGPKIRRVAREHPPGDLDELLTRYRRLYPRDRLSATRALAALSAGPDAMAVWRELPAHAAP